MYPRSVDSSKSITTESKLSCNDNSKAGGWYIRNVQWLQEQYDSRCSKLNRNFGTCSLRVLSTDHYYALYHLLYHATTIFTMLFLFQTFLNSMNTLWLSMWGKLPLNFMVFDTEDDLQAAYWRDPYSVPLAVIFEDSKPISQHLL